MKIIYYIGIMIAENIHVPIPIYFAESIGIRFFSCSSFLQAYIT